MNDHTFNARIAELENTISDLPPEDRDRLMEMSRETQQRHEEIRQAIEVRSEMLDNLSLAMNYLCFDLEATKRENMAMRMRILQLHQERGDNLDFLKPGD
ncbi:MAG: hypothetical protein IH891_03845 [Planctomycetes bacterium]|nr:hypothetical protein [Planctomycetota bacterium]